MGGETIARNIFLVIVNQFTYHELGCDVFTSGISDETDLDNHCVYSKLQSFCHVSTGERACKSCCSVLLPVPDLLIGLVQSTVLKEMPARRLRYGSQINKLLKKTNASCFVVE